MHISPSGSEGIHFDFLSASDTLSGKANLVYSILWDKDDKSDDTDSMLRYIKDCLLYLYDVGSALTLKNVLSLDVDVVRAGISRCMTLSERDRENEIEFLNSGEVYRYWGIIDNRAEKFRDCGLIDIFSERQRASEFFLWKCAPAFR
jgi:hypothetical protein